MPSTYLYLYDLFTPVELSFIELARAFEEDLAKSYMLSEGLIEKSLAR